MQKLIPLVLMFVSFGLAGCGSDLSTVEGTVTLDEKPVGGVEVRFEPVSTDPDAGTAIGYTNAEGHYTLHYPGRQEGAPPGEYLVRIAGGEIEDGGPPVRIPAKYNTQSDLKRTVEPGANTFNFPLESQ